MKKLAVALLLAVCLVKAAHAAGADTAKQMIKLGGY